MTYGTLYGIGVGPGDPELLTLKAARLLRGVDVILAAASPKNDYSQALDIAREHLREGVEIMRLDFPMTRDEQTLRMAWRANAARVADLLATGRSAAFLTLGDPMTYSTFGYLLKTLGGLLERIPVVIVPGITSYQAAAAHTGRVLVEAGENLSIVSGVAPREELERVLTAADNAVILKAYRNFPVIRQTLEDLGLLDHAVFVTRLGQEGEDVVEDLRTVEDKPHYFSLILVRRKAPTADGA